LMFFILLVLLIRTEPDIVRIRFDKTIDTKRPSDVRIIMYALVYALAGTFMVYFLEKAKFLTNK
jgi:hypothetical protein